MNRVDTALAQLQSARAYTNDLLDHISENDWFRQPAEGVTHIAWQVGHITIAEYGLALRRCRGTFSSDTEFVPNSYMKLFGKGSTPSPNASDYPTPAEIRGVLNQVHAHVVDELPKLDDAVWDESTVPQHPMFATKLGSFQFCSLHEMLHAGQIALLRRLLGKEAIR